MTADDFATFFVGKVDSVRASTGTTPLYDVPWKSVESTLDVWTAVTTDEVGRLMNLALNKTSQLDPAPTYVVSERHV